MQFLLLITILLCDTFSQDRRLGRPLQNLYSKLKKDLDAVESKISGQMAEMENTLIMKIEGITKEASTESTPKRRDSVSAADEYGYGYLNQYDGSGSGSSEKIKITTTSRPPKKCPKTKRRNRKRPGQQQTGCTVDCRKLRDGEGGSCGCNVCRCHCT